MGFASHTFKPAFRLIALAFLLFISSTATASQKMLVWGDSLSAAYGIPIEKGWVNLMRKELGSKVEIINGSISGETTRGGLTRLPQALATHKPDYLLLELGANDGLRGLPPSMTKKNLKKMIEQAQHANATVILLGMKIPPNYGIAYSKKFEAIFSELTNEFQILFIPFFMANVIENLELLQEDELHPTAEAQPLLLKEILPTVSEILYKKSSKPI